MIAAAACRGSLNSGMSEDDAKSPWERLPAEAQERLLEQFTKEIWEDFRAAFPLGAVVAVTTDETFGVLVDGTDETERARRIVGYVTDGMDVPRPIVLTPAEVVQLISLALYEEPRALRLGS